MENCIEAKPSSNTNKYLLFSLINLFEIKFPKIFLDLIIDIVKNSNIYIFEKNINSIEQKIFSFCTKLNTVIIPNSVTYIQNYSFYYCINLINITIPNSVISIGESSFYYCVNLININIPNSVINIGESSFCNCNNLTNITIPNSVINIGECAFYFCSSLKNVNIEHPKLIINLDNKKFSDVIKKFLYPKSITKIRKRSFPKEIEFKGLRHKISS